MNTRQWPVRPEGVPFHIDPDRERRQYVPLHIVRAPEVRHRVGPWHVLLVAICLMSAAFSAWAFAGCRKPVDATVRYEVDNPRRAQARREATPARSHRHFRGHAMMQASQARIAAHVAWATLTGCEPARFK